MLLKILPFALYIFSLSPGFAKQAMPMLLILYHSGSVVTLAVVILIAAKFKPLVISVSGFVLSYAANMYNLMVYYGFFLLSAQFSFEREEKAAGIVRDTTLLGGGV
jgi:hypothetical protein